MGKETILISFSGGRTSAFMTKWILESEKFKNYEKVVVFANTGKEREETLEFVNECDKRWDLEVNWIESVINKKKGKGSGFKIVDFESANRDGSLFEEMISVYGLPNITRPHCSRELKEVPIHKFMSSFSKDYHTAIGIRADEHHRVKDWKKAKEKKFIYPLITDFRVDSLYIRKFWESQYFDLNLKDYEGNCDMCWKKSNRKLLTLVCENPKLLNWWNDMEIKHGEDEYTFFRGNKSSIDLIDLAKKPFQKAIDTLELHNMTNVLFDPQFDQEESCYCR